MSLLRILLRLPCFLVAALASSASGAPFAYVTNFTGGSASVIDVATATVTATIPLAGCGPIDIAILPSGARVYVACASVGELRVIDTATNTVVTTVATGSGVTNLAVNPAGTSVYVSRNVINDVFVLDTATDTITASIPGFVNPAGIAIHPSGASAYAADAPGDSIRVVDTATNTITATIPVGDQPARVAFNPAGTRAYVTNNSGNSVSVIDTATQTVIDTVAVGAGPRGVAVNAAGTRVYVANNTGGTNSISIIDTATNTVTTTVPTGAGTQPRMIAFAPDGRYLVVQQTGDSLAIYDPATDTVQATIPVGDQPTSIAIVPASPPGVTIDQAAAQQDPTNAATVNFTAVFAEPVTGFTGGDISFAGSTVAGALVANVTGGPTTYNVAVTGMTSAGTVVASIPAGAAADGIGSPSLASTSTDNTVTIELTPPTVTIDQAGAQADPAIASPINFTVVFSEPVTGFAGADVSFTGSTASGTLAAAVTGGPTTYNVAVSGMTSNGTVVASIPAGGAADGAGNLNTVSTSTDNTVTFAGFDVTPPAVTIDQAGAQADPTIASPINFTVVFSEVVTGFTGADVSFAGSTTPGTLTAAVTGAGTIYNVAVSGMTGSGTVVASVPAGAAADGSGNLSLASTSVDNTVAFTFVRTSFTGPSATGSGTITASFTGGGPTCSFGTAQFIAAPPGAPPVPPVAPAGVAFPHGLFDFTTTGCAPGSTLAFTITYPSAPPAGTLYFKYGPTSLTATPHWYVLAASFAGSVVTFTITDGGMGDDDLAANGTIVDQGGPGIPGPGGAQPVPTLSQWAMLLLAALMLLAGAAAIRRRR